ncbi:membrane-spanning 4-domains subfamily A member 15-like [Scyliorhinus canicula]|uniref:membrane-spanning 4-domains subfamily A member 15-like n=1 Tax=Scyliorhinus canicula TaxID=7830 RepID=UPI0018F4A93D|nr:membrane-spanning 4-domains subfamily A member 15-like [Scyliorhinus canicula]
MATNPDSQRNVAVTVTHLYTTDPAATPGGNTPITPQTAYAQKFLEGEPKALGVTAVLIGIVQILFGIPLALFTNFLPIILASPFLIGTMFVVSGALSIAAEQNPHIKLLRACLATNIISALLAISGVIVYLIDIQEVQICIVHSWNCQGPPQFYALMYYTFIVLLLFTLLELTISIAIAAFVCKSTRCCHPYSSMPVLLLDNNMSEEQ